MRFGKMIKARSFIETTSLEEHEILFFQAGIFLIFAAQIEWVINMTYSILAIT